MSVLTTFTLVTENSEEAILVSVKELEQIMCIQYPIIFLDDIIQDSSALDLILALLDLGSEVNAIHPNFAKKLGFVMQTTNIGAQKIDGTTFETFKIVVTAFLVTDQANRIGFFEEIFFVINISLDVVLGMLFFTLSNANIDFLKREL